MKKSLLNSVTILALFMSSCGTAKLKKYSLPHTKPVVTQSAEGIYSSGNNTLVQNQYGLWELYLEGSPLELGLNNGALTDSIYKYQEKVFFNKVEEIVPSKGKQRFLRMFLAWYNRKLPRNVSDEFKDEIYGLSRFASDSLNFIAPKYARNLYLHGAHDLGHALQDLALVGCTSFAVWGENSQDRNLLIGRNFDFYAGDDFSKNKVVAFVKPSTGYPYMSVTWPGMVGVVSGMNLQGLTVTINAGKSSIPLKAKTPISLLTREIVQHAKNIEEAIAIVKKRKVFVSESIMVGSAEDGKAVLIEVSPKKMDVFEVENQSKLVCSNHFQSKAYKDDKKNNKHIKESHSQYRYEKMNLLLDSQEALNVTEAVAILRNKEGLSEQNIGYGNEKSINQLLAHHGIVFQPATQKVWVSANPYQLGAFVAYDLNTVFAEHKPSVFADTAATQPEDPFLYSESYKNYETFRIEDRAIDKALKVKTDLSESYLESYIALNPEFWVVYYKTGRYYLQKGQADKARFYFEKALTKEITTLPAKQEIEKKLSRLKG